MTRAEKIKVIQKTVGMRLWALYVVLLAEMGVYYFCIEPGRPVSSGTPLLWWIVGIVSILAVTMFIYGPIIDLAYYDKED